MKNNPVLIFDGVCNLCNNAVDFFISRDKEKIFRYAPLQGEFAKANLDSTRLKNLDSVVLLYEGKLYIKSQAILKALIILGWPYRLCGIFKLVPICISDKVYDLIASNRYKFFGKKDSCRLPTVEEKSLFLD